MEIFDVIDQLEDIMETSFTVPLIRKSLVDKTEIMELLGELRLRLPEDLKQAKWVKDEREKILADGRKEAERRIAEVPISDRTAEWHYLNSVLLMRRGNVNDAMRELEMACSMEPGNLEYQKAKEMFNTGARGYGSTYYGGSNYRRRSSSDDACDCCMNLVCLDCLCECMGGDLIRCI